jgi:hypothetical protein
MGFDIPAWTVTVLEEGLPPLPAQLEKSQTVPLALWRGERYGAVLFVRLWRNGDFDHDCAITTKADGSWDEPHSYGGGGWMDDPLRRSQSGWDGDPVSWAGTTALNEVRAVKGAASLQVGSIGVEQEGRRWQVPIESAGAFIVGLEDPAPATLRALDHDGGPLLERDAVWRLPAVDEEGLSDDEPRWSQTDVGNALGISEPETEAPPD